MNAQLKPTATNVLASNSSASSSILNDLVSKMNAQTGGAMQDEQKAAFSKWLERHTTSTASADAVKQSAKAMPVQAHANQTTQPAVNRVPKPMHAEHSHADAQAVAKQQANRKAEQTPNKNAQAKAGRKDQADASAKTSKPTDEAAVEKSDADEVAFRTQLGEGTAIVRELLPPSDVQRGDPASMMAWLAGLTQSDAQLAQAQADAKEAGLGKSEGRDGTDSNVAALKALLSGRGESGVATTALDQQHGRANMGKPEAGGLDVSAWQASQAMAQLSLQSSISASSGSEGGTDPFAALAAAQGSQLARSNLEGHAVNNHVTDTLQSPVTSPQFADELAEKVTMFMRMAKDDGTMTAELHLNPAEMGPINIKIALDGQNAQIDFAAAALETRQALEASMPMLSSALDEVGLSLTGGGVSSQTQQSFGQQFAQSGGSPDGRSSSRISGRTGTDGVDEPVARSVNVARLTQKGGLDLYA